MYKSTKTHRKLKGLPQNNYPVEVILHQTGGTDSNPLEDTSHHTAEIVEAWHNSKPGWIGLGYHYFIEADGFIWYGRPEHINGAHTVGYNTKSIGICLAGNFDATYPTKAQEEAFKVLYRDISTRFPNLPVNPHRKYANKTCFGKNLSDDYGQKLADRAVAQAAPEIDDLDVEAVDKYLEEENSRLLELNVALKEEVSILRKLIRSLVKIFEDLWGTK